MRIRSKKFVLLLVSSFISSVISAAPQQAVVKAGSVQINSQTGKTHVQQLSDRAVVNWQSFSVGADEQVIFSQPDSSSAILNRVTGHQVSAILGRIDANGQVLLINPRGIVFGKNSQVNVSSLIATTTDIANQNFMKGKLAFDRPSSINAKIINEGQISASENGLVALVAPQVSNSGVITARLGKVVLAAGETFTIDLYGDELISFAVDNRDIKAIVEHSGVINVEGGQAVLMTARDGGAVLDNMINMSGVIKANSVSRSEDGAITLTAGDGSANVSGYMTTSAGKVGNAGDVLVWSDGHTEYTGQIDARGGAQSGDGGFVEVSGKKTLKFAGMVDAGADAGKAGTLLLDPEYVTIGTQEAATLAMILTNGTNANVEATIDINVLAMIDGRGGATGGALTLNAGNNVNVQNYIVTNDGTITLNANAGAINLASGFGLYSGTGSVTLNAGTDINIDSPVDGKNLRLTAGRHINVRQYLASKSSPMTLHANSGSVLLGSYNLLPGASSVSVTAGTNITVNSIVDAYGISLLAGNDLNINHYLVGRNSGMTLRATSGSVNIAAGYGLYPGSGSLQIQSGANITAASRIESSSISGVGLTAGNNIALNHYLFNLAGPLSVSAGGALSVAAGYGVYGISGNLNLQAGAAITTNSIIEHGGNSGSLSMNSGGNININEHVVTNNIPVNLSAGGAVIQLTESGVDADGHPFTKQIRTGNASITINATTDYSPGSLVTTGALYLHTDGNMTIVSAPVYETTGDVELSAGGYFTTASLPVANITSGANLLIDVGGDINVDFKLGPWEGDGVVDARAEPVSGGSITLVSGGSIHVNDDIATYDGALSLFAGTTAAKVANCASPPCTINLVDNKVVNSGNAPLSLTSYSDLLIDGNAPNVDDDTSGVVSVLTTTGAMSLESTTGDVTFEEVIPDTTGALTVRAGNDININQIIHTNAQDAGFYAGNDFNLPAGAGIIDIGFGNLWIEAVNDITAMDVATSSNLTVKSTLGNILQGSVVMSEVLDNGNFPSSIHLAGYLGISNFNAGDGSNIDALSAAGSVTALGFYHPGSLRIIAYDSITLSSSAMDNPSLYAGDDITLTGGILGNTVIAKAGGDFFVDDTGVVTIADNLDIAAGTNPFSTLGGVTVAGVAVPAWTAPSSGGNVTFGNDNINDVVWIEEGSASENAFITMNATNDIVLPRVHLSWSLGSAADTQDARQTQTTFTLNASNEVTLQQIETMGDVTIQTTNNDINLGSTIGAHVTVETPDSDMWNPTDKGVANIIMNSANADINMHEARAEGDITIAAPNGQINFIAPGGLKGIEGGGTVSVTDSDGVIYDAAISLATVDRIPNPGTSAPAITPGPTMAGAAAPAIPGALPPVAPVGVNPTNSAAPGSNGSTGIAPDSSPLTEIAVNEVNVEDVSVEDLPFGEIDVTASDVEGLDLDESVTQESAGADEITELLAFESPLQMFLTAAADGLFLVSSQQDVQINPLVFDTKDGTYTVFETSDDEDKDLGR